MQAGETVGSLFGFDLSLKAVESRNRAGRLQVRSPRFYRRVQ